PWNARSLEWAIPSPAPAYNFAKTPVVETRDAFWNAKKSGKSLFKGEYKEVHMPNYSGQPIIASGFLFVFGFAMIFSMWVLAIISAIGFFGCLIYRTFEKDHGYHISPKEMEEMDKKNGGATL